MIRPEKFVVEKINFVSISRFTFNIFEDNTIGFIEINANSPFKGLIREEFEVMLYGRNSVTSIKVSRKC